MRPALLFESPSPHAGGFPATEARLLAVACGATAAQVERLVRGWRQADHAAQADGERLRLASRMLSTQVDDNGMLVLRARLTPEVGADGDEPTIAQRRAGALGLVAESALAGGLDPGNPGDRFQVTVHVPADTLASREPPSTPPRLSAETRAASAAASQPVAAAAHAVMEQAGVLHAGRETAAGVASETATATPQVCSGNVSSGACEPAPPAAGLDAGQAVIEQTGGLHVGREAARRLACDAALVALRHGAGGEVLDVGRRTRVVPTALRRALLDRDRSQCQFPRLQLPPLRRPPRRALGRRRGDPAAEPGAVGSTTARCTKRAFRW